MKRTFLLVLVAVAAVAAWAPQAVAQKFSNPILLGGDEPSGATSEARTSQATNLKFFIHSEAQDTDVNFKDDEGRIEAEDLYDTIFVDDVVATPGYAPRSQQVTGGSNIVDHPTSRMGFSNVSPIGPEDFSLDIKNPGFFTFSADYMYEYSIADEPANLASHRLMLADIREETSGEFFALFGEDPLEKVIIGGIETAIIGNAAEVAPYSPDTYPATVIAKEPFQWCAINVTPIKPFPSTHPCFSTPTWDIPVLSKNKYEEVFLYDVANLGNGFVGASYDPLQLGIKWKIGATYTFEMASPPLYLSGTAGYELPNRYYATYYSPLAQFRMVTDGSEKRYRFSGYSSLELPSVKIDVSASPPADVEGIWRFLLTNWVIPIATNPISTEAVDLGGASSWQSCPSSPCSPAVDFPDTDLAVVYQTTFFPLDHELDSGGGVIKHNYINGPFGRPAVFGDGSHHTLRELLGTCSATPCAVSDFTPLPVDRFPDSVISLALFYKQQNEWAVGGDNQDYDKTNPSHVFEPANSSIIGPGAYDSAVLTDYALDATYRKQFLVVPSAYDDPTSDADKAVLYLVDPLKGENLFFLYPYSDLSTGYNIFTNPPLGPYNPAPPRCVANYMVKKTALRLPQEVIRLERPSDGFVPHEVVNGKVDNNECEDFIVTWRGKKTMNITADHVAFDDGSGTNKMFSSRVSIVLRHEAAPGVCKLTAASDYGDIPKHIDVGDLTSFQVASAAIGDFDGDGKNDIAVGNLIPEEETAYAYLYKGGTSVPFSSLDRERFRVGFKQAAELVGVGKIAADHTELGADALAQINGLPLMLPDIDCPDYSVSDDRTVGSIFETYISIAHNFASRWVKTHGPGIAVKIGPSATPVTVHIDPFESAFPFVDLATSKPMPTRCAPEKAACIITEAGASVALPFYEDDPCCVAPCAMPKAEWLNRCAAYTYAYGRVGRACQLIKYVYAWGDPTDPVNCAWASSELPDSGSYADADDRGGGEGGSTDYASLWQPDRVVGHDGGAIAYSADLVPAQYGSTDYETNTLNARPMAETTDAGAIKNFNASVANDAGGFALFNMKFPLRQLLGSSLAPLAETSGDVRQIQDAIYTSEEIGRMEQELGAQMPGLIMGAPSSFEHMIMQPIVAQLTALMGQAGGLQASANRDSVRKGAIFGGCSLVADSPDMDLSGMAEKVRSLARRVWDLIVPDADAATCGDGTVEGTEYCDAPDFCKKGPCPSMAGTTICRPPWDAEACSCNDAPCGDGCWIPTASLGPEGCDLTAKPDNWNGLAWATGSGFFNPTDVNEQNYGCPKTQSCLDGCICGNKRCGDGQINEGESCDPAADTTIWPNHGCPDTQPNCTSTCGCTATITTTPGDITPLAVCGDGIKNGSEVCDPAAPSSGADCPSGYFCVVSGPSACTCQTVVIPGTSCGNSILETGEKCDGTLFASGVNCSAFGNTCRDSASSDPCTCCGDGVVQTALEECDPPVTGTCGAAAGGLVCNNDCKCVTTTTGGPSCGNGVLDAGESCDIGNPCPAGQYCTITCDCKDIPKLDWDVRLPIGTIMPGHREGTAVVRKRPVTCNYNGIPGDLPSEECDTAGLTPADAAAQVASVCTSPPVDGAVADVCDMSDCSCNYDYPWCAPDAECSASGDCPEGMICSIECVCVADPGESIDDTPDPQQLLATDQNDCFIHCDTFSTDADAEVYRKWNEEARSWSGRSDDLFCEPEQLVSIVCRVGAGSAVDNTTLPTLTASESPLAGTTTLPYMVLQRSGSEFVDTGTLEYKEFTLVEAPIRILPMEGADASKAVILPNLTSSTDLAGLEGVAPMAVSSVAYGAGGVVQVNNMIEHRMFSVVPGQDYEVTIEGSAQTIKAEGTNIPEGAAITIHELKLRLPPDCASWTGVAGYQGCPNIEDRQFSADAVKGAIEANKAALGVSTSAIYTDLPWEQNLNYNYNLIQSIYGAAGESAPPATYIPFGHLAGKPLAMGAGGGCGCYVADGSASFGSVAPFILVMMVPVGGIIAGAVRRRRRR